VLPCLLFEDEHLLVVNKPAGLNTHAPGPHAGEGIYDWLRHREARWATLAIIHRLDKETSGVLVFSKSPLANRSLTAQFTARTIKKKYILLTDRPVAPRSFTIRTAVVRAGDKYLSRPVHAGAEAAETRFSPLDPDTLGRGIGLIASPANKNLRIVRAEPLTGRSHQIRVHAAARGFPVLGDVLYGGTVAPRVCLHAHSIALRHPESGEDVAFTAPVDFAADIRGLLRSALIDPGKNSCWRRIHGASDGWPGWYVDKLGDFLLAQTAGPIPPGGTEATALSRTATELNARGVYHKRLRREIARTAVTEAGPKLLTGATAPSTFVALENGLQFELSFQEGYSVGLFLDQRDNRRRVLANHVAAGFPLFSRQEVAGGAPAAVPMVLNAFAYTCGFSVCAAKSGARVTSLDISRKYLEWGKRNFALNGLDPARHDFIYGDVFNWFQRLARKGRRFDLILLDPPTFSRSKDSGVFRAVQDYGRLVSAALPLLKPGGVLFASTNAADWAAPAFLSAIETAVGQARRKILQQHYAPQPPDFPISREEPAYLKSVWLRITPVTPAF
jgi:23S rRNA (cytosine1962-C5)-methyltransferase